MMVKSEVSLNVKSVVLLAKSIPLTDLKPNTSVHTVTIRSTSGRDERMSLSIPNEKWFAKKFTGLRFRGSMVHGYKNLEL